jgi:hypothetical protein
VSEFPARWGGLRPRRLLALLACEPVIGPALLALGRALSDVLEPRTLETVALRVSARRDCHYVWRGHCAIAVDLLGAEEIARIAHGTDAALVRAVDEILDGRSSSHDPQVRIATGFYDVLCGLLRDTEPEDDALPVAGLETPADAARSIASVGIQPPLVDS